MINVGANIVRPLFFLQKTLDIKSTLGIIMQIVRNSVKYILKGNEKCISKRLILQAILKVIRLMK